jgi:DNA repair protein RecO (recombination protein O)
MNAADRPPRQYEPGFILHTYPFRETSVLLEAFTRAQGRVALIARGARGAHSTLRGQLIAFQPLLLSWSGKAEPRRLHTVEWQGGQPFLKGQALLCGFYMNELLLKLTQREDPHEGLFDAYLEALARLARELHPAPILRCFELRLLRELGYALALERDAENGEALEANAVYAYLPERGPLKRAAQANAVQFRGKTLLDLAREDFSDPLTLAESKQLMRMLIKQQLGRQELNTRQLLKDLQDL